MDDESALPLGASLPLVPPRSDRASEADERTATKSLARRRTKAGTAGCRTGPVAPPDELVSSSSEDGEFDEAMAARWNEEPTKSYG